MRAAARSLRALAAADSLAARSLRALACLAGALVLGLTLASCGREAPAGPPDIVIVLIDTWRWDAFGANGSPHEGITPNLDALAARGVRFAHAYASSPWTLPAVGSLLTGRYPTVHGAYGRGDGRITDLTPLRESATTLAEHLARRGYATLAVANAPFLDPSFGFGRGFTHYDYVASTNLSPRRADLAVERAVGWLGAMPEDRPRFVLLHLFDPHLAYDPPAPFDRRYTAGYAGPLRAPLDPLRAMRAGRFVPGPPGIAFVRGLYAGEVAYTDHALERFLRALDDTGRPYVAVVTADHGEEILDHGGWEHGHTMHAELLRVPLVVVPAPEGRAGSVVEEPVGVLDVFPTLLEAAGIALPADLDGRSLGPLLAGRPDAPREVFSEREHLGPPAATALRADGHALIYRPGGAASLLYDLRADPGETRDLAVERPDLVRSLEERLTRVRQALDARATPHAGVPMDPELEEKLRSLGYVGGGSDRGSDR